MIEWGALVKSLGYDSEPAMWHDLYTEKKLSVAQLSRKLDVSRNVVRAELDKFNVKIRSRGGPNNSKVVLTNELLDDIRNYGIAIVAKRLKMDYTTLYKRLYKRGLTVKSLREGARVASVEIIVDPPPSKSAMLDKDVLTSGSPPRDKT